ncbi:hypothetical protein H257_10307 [Aphanomyces astaci]|uniref:Uncharacterized protein n=1 Tax=Aphanomyces astaci TaxID=112090 RepID=W4G721_APHAT|nr:hypothetical protein H257_10307 [Aphanomyces astaci]ETV75470.1 hypothetical protein H257_10307 [Aphanomyces astaci]KAF0718670.1 hypothetical protein AaE_010591 [Aphanomyces astaci]|eukprot:XP_009835104.1 hypothetical protein H257_10307 [Aphanomyces astaci]
MASLIVRRWTGRRALSEWTHTQLFLHISPCGDWWTGSNMYAAKHLSSDYVKSIALPDGFDEVTLETLPNASLQRMYDTGVLDATLVRSRLKPLGDGANERHES